MLRRDTDNKARDQQLIFTQAMEGHTWAHIKYYREHNPDSLNLIQPMLKM